MPIGSDHHHLHKDSSYHIMSFRHLETYHERNHAREPEMVAKHLVHGILSETAAHLIAIVDRAEVEERVGTFKQVLWNRLYALQRRPIERFGQVLGAVENGITLYGGRLILTTLS